MTKLRPMDVLRQLLVDNRGPENDAVRKFFREQREDQACATCLILACLDSAQNAQLSEWATRAFFLYGGEPKVSTEMQSTAVQNVTGIQNTSLMQSPGALRSNTPIQSPVSQFHTTSMQGGTLIVHI